MNPQPINFTRDHSFEFPENYKQVNFLRNLLYFFNVINLKKNFWALSVGVHSPRDAAHKWQTDVSLLTSETNSEKFQKRLTNIIFMY